MIADAATTAASGGRAGGLCSEARRGVRGLSRGSSVRPRFGSDPVEERRFSAPPWNDPPVVMPYALRDFDIDLAGETPEVLDRLAQLSDRCHYRVEPGQPYGIGHYEFCGLADGFFIVAGDIEIQASQYALISAPGVLRIHVASDGDSEYIAPDGETLRSEGPSASVVIEPASQPAAQAVFAGYNRFVDVFIHREMLKLLYAGGEHELPPVLRAFLNGDLERTAARALPLGAALLRCLDDVHGCGIEGLRRRLFLQSKAVEILCHACEALERDELLASPEASAVTARSVLKAQRLLMENFVTPPSLESLAHEVGLSRSGLCAGFRQILGQSVFDYIQDLRMQQALALLNERTVSITQIAFAVGYNHVSSFSVAVQRRFGATPSELRRRSA